MDNSQKQRWRSTWVALIALAIAAVAAFGFAAANTVPESGAGDGSGRISGYTVSNIDYDLEPTDPTLLSGVSMRVTPTDGAGAAGEVSIVIADGSATGISATCTLVNTAGTITDWDCSLVGKGATVLAAANLRVIAVD